MLRIHNDFIENSTTLPEKTANYRGLPGQLRLWDFKSDYKGNIGFEGLLKREGEKGDFTQYAIKIPPVKIESLNPCQNCGGSGKSSFDFDNECMYCSGSGKNISHDWYEANAISSSLSVLTSELSLTVEDTDSPFHQLMIIETLFKPNRLSVLLWGHVSPSLRQWLVRHHGKNTIPRVNEAMIATYEKMLGEGKSKSKDFRIEIDNEGGLTLECPEEGCSIYPEPYSLSKKGRGYEFSNHNVDNPAQQLTLLAGLASLHDIARYKMDLLF